MINTINNVNDILNSFNIKASCTNIEKYKHFSFYDIKLSPGTRINRIQHYATELALAMCTNSSIVIKVIPSLGIVRLQTTHKDPELLNFEDLFLYSTPINGVLPLLIGETNEGKPLWIDLAKNPHLLVAGTTGSGKSVFLHTLIANIFKREDTRLFLIDTKCVEFAHYQNNGVKDVVTNVSNDYDQAVQVLEHLNHIMEARYEYMSKLGILSLEQFPNLFHKIVLIVDEVADLMLCDKNKYFEKLSIKLAQKARAAGIYMIFATQRPSVDIFTGLIKSNFPARLACRVISKVDSRVVLDRHGAESLIGKGDAIFNNSIHEMVRFQIAFSEPSCIVRSYVD